MPEGEEENNTVLEELQGLEIEGKIPLGPKFSTKPEDRTADPNPTFFWIPTGDCHDFQLADNDGFEHPLIDLLKTYDLGHTLEPGFPADGDADKVYHYRVRGHNNIGPGPWTTGSFEFRSKLPPKPEFTRGPLRRTADHQLYFQWAASEEITTFEFQVAKDLGFEEIVISEQIEKMSYDLLDQFNDLGQNDGVYFYRVRSILPDGEHSQWSFEETVDTFELVTRPLPPVFILRPDIRTNNKRPRFAWDTSVALGARKFRFEISNTFDFSGQVITYETEGANEDAYLMEGKLPAGTYYYRICSVDHNGKQSVWNYNPVTNRFLLNPDKPNEPIVEIEEFINNIPMPISGTKDPGASVLLNGETIVPPDQEMAWSTQLEIFHGVNVLVFHISNANGILSNPVVKICTFDPQMRNYDFYTRDSMDDQGEEPGKADYGSGPDTLIFPPMEKLKIDPNGEDTEENFDSYLEFQVYTDSVNGTLEDALAEPAKLAGYARLDPRGINQIFVRVQNKGFLSDECNFRLFWAPYSTWPKVSQWVEITPEVMDEGGNITRWHPFPEEIPGGNSGMIVSEPLMWGPEDPGFPLNGEHGCIVTVIQAENMIEDPSFLLDRPLEGSYMLQMLDAHPEVFRLATYLSNNVSFKNINVVSDLSIEPVEGKRGKEQLVPEDVLPEHAKHLKITDPQPRFWREQVLINSPSLKTPDASLILDVSNFDVNGSVWLKIPKDLLPPNRRLKITGGTVVDHNDEMFPELKKLLFNRPSKFLVYRVSNEYEMEVGGLDLDLNQKSTVELVYGLSMSASENVQYTISLIQKFRSKEVGRVMSIIKTQKPGFYRYFAEVTVGKLHMRDCKLLKKIAPEDLAPFSSITEARLSGHAPCDKCFDMKPVKED